MMRPRNPPIRAPTIPRTTVKMKPRGSLPGMRNLATIPTIRPNTIHINTLMIRLPRWIGRAVRLRQPDHGAIAMPRAAGGHALCLLERRQLISSLIAARAHVTRQEDTMRAQKTTRHSTRGSTRRPAEKDAIAELEETTSKATSRRQTLLKSIEQELKIHTKIEEEIFYPAFRDASSKEDDKKLYYEALEEHHVVDMVLPEIKKIDAGSDEFAAKAKVLKDLVEHHAEEEEIEMFPRARKLMDREELLQLGQQIAQAKESMTGGILTRLTEMVRS